MLKKIKNSKLLLSLLFFIIILALILISKFALAFLAPDLGTDSSTKGDVTATGDTLIFSKGNDLSLNATTDNFNAGSGNITVTTNPSVKLVSSAKTNNATATYTAGCIIYNNTFRYSNGTNPELILTIKDENNNIVTSATNLTYVTANGVSGFDITNKNGVFNVVLNHQINTNSSTTGTTHTWSYTLTFVNYTATDQSINENASISIDVILQKEPIPTIASTCVGQNMASCIKTNYNLEKLDNHTAALPNSAQDNSIRYSGANPNNYVCFGPGATPAGQACPEENQYRIIGVFGNQVKLIKKTSLGDKVWNSSNVNTWAGSTMDTYLNGEYLNNLTPTWSNKIASNTWQVGGMTYSNGKAVPATAYNYEVGANKANVTFNGKIGLMYASDYGFAAQPQAWTLKLGGHYDNVTDYTNPIAKANNWLFANSTEWTMSRISADSYYAFTVYLGGAVNYVGVANGFAARAVFYLQSSVNLNGGNGTAIDPYRV